MQYQVNGWDIDELYEYIRKSLDLFILLKAPYKFHIKDNLRIVFVYFVISQIIGMQISSKEANNFVTDMLGYKDPDIIFNYKTNLRRMGWFIKANNNRYIPIQSFNYTAENFKLEKIYNFKLEYVKKKDYNFIDSKRKTSS